MSKSNPNSGKKQENHSTKHYLYVDMDYINSFLAQSEQGLHLTSRHTNSNTDGQFEERGSQYVEVDAKGNKKSDPTVSVGMLGSALGLGGDTKAHADVAATIENFSRGEKESAFTEHAIEVAMHDYAINLFIDSIEDKIADSNNSRYFITNDSDWNLLDYSDIGSKKLASYIKLFNSGFAVDEEVTQTISTIYPQAEALMEVLSLTLPSPYAVRQGEYVGHMDPKWMRYKMETILFEFGSIQKFNVLGIKTSNNRHSIDESTLQIPQKLFTSMSPYLDEHFLPLATEMSPSDQIFKPIVIYMNVE